MNEESCENCGHTKEVLEEFDRRAKDKMNKTHWSRPLFGIGLILIALVGGYTALIMPTVLLMLVMAFSVMIVGVGYTFTSLLILNNLERELGANK